VGIGLNLQLKSLFLPQSPPHQRIKASPPQRRRTRNGEQALDLLTIALKIDSNKPMRLGII